MQHTGTERRFPLRVRLFLSCTLLNPKNDGQTDRAGNLTSAALLFGGLLTVMGVVPDLHRLPRFIYSAEPFEPRSGNILFNLFIACARAKVKERKKETERNK